VAASDFVFATPRSTFNLPETLWGLLPCCVLPFLIRRVGFQPAHAMMLSTLPITAQRAHGVHLVDEIDDDPERPIRRLLGRVEKLDPSTVAAAKGYARQMWFLSEEMEQLAISQFRRLMDSTRVRSAIADFATTQTFPWERSR
jgi:3-carboxymethyl-3-hydroxy-acyl-[acp] dehydratase